jgi:hypothetical protein
MYKANFATSWDPHIAYAWTTHKLINNPLEKFMAKFYYNMRFKDLSSERKKV